MISNIMMCNGICRIINGVNLNNKLIYYLTNIIDPMIGRTDGFLAIDLLYMARWVNLHIENMFCQIWKGLDLIKDGIYSSQTGLRLNQQRNNLQERLVMCLC